MVGEVGSLLFSSVGLGNCQKRAKGRSLSPVRMGGAFVLYPQAETLLSDTSPAFP